jgi:ZIP family zinc transporter
MDANLLTAFGLTLFAGIAVSVPIYYATGSRRKAFFWSFLSGLSEPVGALIGWLVLLPFMSDLVFGTVFALVAGMAVMAVSLQLFV